MRLRTNKITGILSLRHEAESAAQSLPALIMAAEKIALGVIHGPHAQKKSGTGEKFWQFREYRAGDRLQDIDWRQSGKTQELYIRQKEWQTTRKTCLWCASGPGMAYASLKSLPRKQDAAHILSLALAILMTQADEQIGLAGDPKTGRSDHQLQKIAQSFLDNTREEPLIPADQTVIPHNASLIMAGDFLAPLEEIEANFSKLATRAGNTLLIQILDPAELELTFSGRVTFIGEERNEKETLNNVASVRDAYIRRMQDHIENIKALCREHNWTHILHRTDDDPAHTLSRIWMALDMKAGGAPS